MIESGKTPLESGTKQSQDICLGRLKLMIVMAKACLLGFPLGEHRRRAMVENARQLEKNWRPCGQAGDESCRPISTNSDPFDEHIFDQRVKLLAVMVRAIAQGYPIGEHRRIALINTVDVISKRLMLESDAEKLPLFLKVA
jgi:hypothetical protein